MNAIQWLSSLRPALPMSIEQPGKHMTNGELRRIIQQKGVLINAETIEIYEAIDFPIISLVFFPNSKTRKTTLL